MDEYYGDSDTTITLHNYDDAKIARQVTDFKINAYKDVPIVSTKILNHF